MGKPPLRGSVLMRTPKKSASVNELIEPSNVPSDMRQHARPRTVRHIHVTLARATTSLMEDCIRPLAFPVGFPFTALCQFFMTP